MPPDVGSPADLNIAPGWSNLAAVVGCNSFPVVSSKHPDLHWPLLLGDCQCTPPARFDILLRLAPADLLTSHSPPPVPTGLRPIASQGIAPAPGQPGTAPASQPASSLLPLCSLWSPPAGFSPGAVHIIRSGLKKSDADVSS